LPRRRLGTTAGTGSYELNSLLSGVTPEAGPTCLRRVCRGGYHQGPHRNRRRPCRSASTPLSCHEGADHRDLAHAIRSCARLRLNFLRLRVYLVDALLRLFRRNAGPRRDRIDLIPPSAGSSAQPAAEDRRIRLSARWSAVLCRWVLPRSHAKSIRRCRPTRPQSFRRLRRRRPLQVVAVRAAVRGDQSAYQDPEAPHGQTMRAVAYVRLLLGGVTVRRRSGR
jgi:hypothetical protein